MNREDILHCATVTRLNWWGNRLSRLRHRLDQFPVVVTVRIMPSVVLTWRGRPDKCCFLPTLYNLLVGWIVCMRDVITSGGHNSRQHRCCPASHQSVVSMLMSSCRTTNSANWPCCSPDYQQQPNWSNTDAFRNLRPRRGTKKIHKKLFRLHVALWQKFDKMRDGTRA